MPNQLTSAGLQVKTVQEIVDSIVTGLQTVYGNDINVAQNSPDGQMVNIYAQVAADQLELLLDVYNGFAVDSAYGQVLDQRVALNGIARKPGTFTFIDVEVTVDRALTLPGLDASVNDPDGTGYTVKDDAGNEFILAATQSPAGAGAYTYSFRAKAIGAIETTPNTITNQVTVTLGVLTVNNPGTATQFGENEETDVELKIRHDKSFSLAATSPVDSIEAALLAIPLVTDAFVPENDTSSTALGITAHSIWAIVENGADQDIGQAIYAKKAPGCGMVGAVSVTVNRPNGTTFVAKFDRPIYENLYIQFTIVPKSAGVTFDTDLLKTQLAAVLIYKLNQSANIGDVVVAMLALAPQGILTDVGVSSNGITYVDILNPTTYQHKFVADPTRIDITA